jgi:hypothetical protein
MPFTTCSCSLACFKETWDIGGRAAVSDIQLRLARAVLADMVIVDRDLFTCPIDELQVAQVPATYLGENGCWSGRTFNSETNPRYLSSSSLRI